MNYFRVNGKLINIFTTFLEMKQRFYIKCSRMVSTNYEFILMYKSNRIRKFGLIRNS